MRTTRTRPSSPPTGQRRTTGKPAKRAPRQPTLTGPDGKQVRLTDLPLVAYWLRCGCVGRAYGVQGGDLLFCEEHADRYKVIRTQS
jgi:hypothetical protein